MLLVKKVGIIYLQQGSSKEIRLYQSKQVDIDNDIEIDVIVIDKKLKKRYYKWNFE